MRPILQVNNLTVYYFTRKGVVRAVDGVSLEAFPQDHIALVGESGCGKTTLGYALLNMVPPPGKIISGEVVIDNVNITKLRGEELRKVRGSLISMVFQDPFTTLDPVRKVGDQIIEVLMEHGVPKDEARAKAYNLLRSVGLHDRFMNAYPHQLSGGQRQRVSIAMAIALKPKVLVADEPTTALDVVVQRQIMDLLDSIRLSGMTIIFITHDIALASERATKIAVMYAGKIVEFGPKERVMSNPLHPYTKALISSVPGLKKSIWPKPIPGLPPDLRNPPRGCRFNPRCPYAGDVCYVREPKMVEVEPQHYVACHIYSNR